MRCEQKACPNPAADGSTYCIAHHAERQKTQQSTAFRQAVEDEAKDCLIVSLGEIPAPRANEASMSLLKAVEALGDGKAMKLRLRKFSKPTLLTTQRYALVKGLRVGLRYVGEWAYMWKMTPEQIKQVEVKAERLRTARAKRGRKVA